MKVINLIPGSPEWLKSRSASKAPVIMGDSNYQTRNELLFQMFSGITKEIDARTQARFDSGHRTEALSREIVEEMIGEDLSPVSASDDEGYLTANFDGVTFPYRIGYEHKDWNEKLVASVLSGVVPNSHAWQLDQQILVGKLDYVIFVVSDGTRDNFISTEYRTTKERTDKLVAAWKQFDIDLANYQPEEATPVAAATPIRDLPVITYQMNGMAVMTNLHADVKPAIVALVEKSKQPLETDQDFADLDLLCKHFAAAEIQCQSIAAQVDAEFKDTDKFKKDLKELQELMATARIAGKKRVTTEKESRKMKIISDARAIYLEHVAALEVEIKPITLNLAVPDFAIGIKSMAKLDNMKSKCSDLVASGKSIADTTATDFRAKLAWCKENAAGMSMLFPDLQQIITKPLDDFTLLITRRIDKHKADEAARLEAERAKMQAEATAKAELEAAARLAAEEARIRAEEQAKAKAEAEQIAAGLAARHEAERVESLRLALEAKAKSEADAVVAIRKCDGNHGGPRCADPECWNDSEAKLIDAAAQREHETSLAGEPMVIKPVMPQLMRQPGMPSFPDADNRPVVDASLPEYPGDQSLINAIQSAYGVSYGTACDWLLEVAESLKVAA